MNRRQFYKKKKNPCIILRILLWKLFFYKIYSVLFERNLLLLVYWYRMLTFFLFCIWFKILRKTVKLREQPTFFDCSVPSIRILAQCPRNNRNDYWNCHCQWTSLATGMTIMININRFVIYLFEIVHVTKSPLNNTWNKKKVTETC